MAVKRVRRRAMRAAAFAPLVALASVGAPRTSVRAQSASDSVLAGATSAHAGSAAWRPWLLGTQVNIITQHLLPSSAPYLGPNTLPPRAETETSQAYGVYAGMEVNGRLQGYLDVEMIRGQGINRATGVAGVTNGDVLRQGSVDLGSGPYVARAYLKYTVPFASAGVDTLSRAQGQIPTVVSSRRLEIFAGKLAASDLFDVNRYANSTRQQFLNWGLFNNTAWDFAADTRGYSNGVALSWVTPTYTVRAGSFQMPRFANGNEFDSDLRRAHGDHVEVTVVGPRTATVVRALVYLNHARMGSYQVALDRATFKKRLGLPDSTPDIVADDQPGRVKYGYGLNVEQPLADGGDTGVFVRLGWSDGANESFAFTEVDRHLSTGIQVSGVHWGRDADRFGAAVLQHGIVAVHRQYLAAGGLGFLLGDGRLTYGEERIFESFYRFQIGEYAHIGPDVQVIMNPGYNRDRGTVTLVAARCNLRY